MWKLTSVVGCAVLMVGVMLAATGRQALADTSVVHDGYDGPGNTNGVPDGIILIWYGPSDY